VLGVPLVRLVMIARIVIGVSIVRIVWIVLA
jgi:hypothetical protein